MVKGRAMSSLVARFPFEVWLIPARFRHADECVRLFRSTGLSSSKFCQPGLVSLVAIMREFLRCCRSLNVTR